MNSQGDSVPWLSVILPCHCGERWLETALASIAAETPDGIEVIFIDSSPGPRCVAIASAYTDRLHIRIFPRPDLNTWQTKTNFGVEAAGAPHICWIGVDDIWLNGRIAAVRSWIDSAPSAALHLAPSAIIDGTGRVLGVWRCPLPNRGALPRSVVTERLLVQNFVAAPAPVINKAAWRRCGGLDTTLWYTADWDMWLKLADQGSVHYHDLVTVGFRIHKGSLTSTGSNDHDDFAGQMQAVIHRHLPALSGDTRRVERAANASVAVNCALAAAAGGNYRYMPGAALAVLKLGPIGMSRYLRDSRLLERVMPRVRAKLSQGL